MLNGFSKYKTWYTAALLIAAAAAYGIFEILSKEKLSPEKQAILVEQAVQSARTNFEVFEQRFASQSRELANYLQEQIAENTPNELLFDALSGYYDFWGISIFRENELWLWSGFAENNFASQLDSAGQFVDVRQRDNVTYLFSQTAFYLTQDDTSHRYDVITTRKIRQYNLLPIGKMVELNPQDLFNSDYDYPINYSFLDTVTRPIQYSNILATQSVDSVGIVYALESDSAIYLQANAGRHSLYQNLFAAMFIVLGLLLMFSFSGKLAFWESLLLRLFSIVVAWLLLANLDFMLVLNLFGGNLQASALNNFNLIYKYGLNTLFIMMVTLTTFNSLLSRLNQSAEDTNGNNRVNPVTAFFQGLASALLILFYILNTYRFFVESDISVMDLHLLPPAGTLIIFIASGIFGLSLITLLCFTAWYVLAYSRLRWWLNLCITAIGFAAGMFIMYYFNIAEQELNWIIYACGLFFFVIIIFSSVLHFSPRVLQQVSRLRLMLLLSYITVCLSYFSIYMGYSERLDNRMLAAAQSFIIEEATEAERITRTVLTDLELALRGLTLQDMELRPDYVKSHFVQQTQQLISDEWESFSISTQLIDNSGTILSEYSSDLDSPAWTKAFNMFSLLIPFEEERIRLENLRPVIRERPLNESNANYSSFRRGWIPLHDFSDSQKRVGWILCSVYRERPQFNKPLRAMMAAQNNDNLSSSINVTEFIKGNAARKTIVGIPLELPGYNRLPEPVESRLRGDSIFFQTSQFGEETLRELFVASGNEQVVRAATTHIGLNNHLFAALRFFFSILISASIFFSVLVWRRDFDLLRANRHFRDRLIDRLILASLLCLILLTTTSYYTINQQNEKNVRSELLDKLNNLAEALTLRQAGNGEPSLEELSSALDSDASIYRNNELDISTTTQIYGQHLLPAMLPWDVYHSIYTKGSKQETRKVVLGNQELLIGFQPWVDQNNAIAGVASIPTFLQAPKFNEQILSTTSYLLGFYVLIFGLFIAATAFITAQLTTPLHALRQGLKKISGGDLETLLPVQSKDEIGSLTNAYNIMVYRLKELQQELSRAEREAAWKEMAQQVAHEIKNPLTPMKLNLQHLERQLKAKNPDMESLKPAIEKIAANMIEQIESLNKIASDFSSFARPIQHTFEPINLNKIMESIQELYSQDDEGRVHIRFIRDAETIIVQGAKDELRRALINLVKNAYEAMPNGGEIVLHSGLDRDNNEAVFSVQDNGDGIPETDKSNIFEPNFSTKTSGTGLGLAITKKIIEEHSGSIQFSSEKGSGTIFIIRLPLSGKYK